MQISIEIHVHAQPEQLRATLASIQNHTVIDHDLVMLPSGPYDEVRQGACSAQGPLQSLDQLVA
jgi:hypothetical protein